MYRTVDYGNMSRLNTKRFVIDKFLGCDFTNGQMITDYRRSPNCKNLIWHENPYIARTRPGYLPLIDEYITIGQSSVNINGIHIYKDSTILVHAGESIYSVVKDDATGGYVVGNLKLGESLMDGLANTKSKSFMFQGELYIIGAGFYLVYNDTDGLAKVEDRAFIPTTVIGRTYEGGGKSYEPVNLLCDEQIYSFCVAEKTVDEVYRLGDAVSGVYSLGTNEYRGLSIKKGDTSLFLGADYTISDTDARKITLTEALVSGETLTATYFTWCGETEYPVADNATAITEVLINGVQERGYTFDSSTKKVIFSTAPKGQSGAWGADNISIQFVASSGAAVINACTIFDIFGGANDTRVFLSGNPNYPNRDWHSGLLDAKYFPDTAYTDIGTKNVPIKCYIKQYDTQMIVKASNNNQEATVYLRQFNINEEGSVMFPVEQGISGTGAVSASACGYLNGYPLILTDKGVARIEGTNVDYRNIIVGVSENIDAKLTREDLSKAFAVDFNNQYYLFVNNQVFVADARMRFTDALGNAQYEWYYWDSISAQCAAVWGKYLIFGNAGRLYRFALMDEVRYVDDNGERVTPIQACWETPKLYFNSVSERKTIYDINCFFDNRGRTKMGISASVDGREVDLGVFDKSGLLDFRSIDFANFCFAGLTDEQVKYIRANLRGFTWVKIKIQTEATEQSPNIMFGLQLIQADYIYAR